MFYRFRQGKSPENKKKFDHPKVILSNTVEVHGTAITYTANCCAFDSVFQAMVHVYAENTGGIRSKIDEAIQRSKDQEYFRLVAVFAKRGSRGRMYHWRTEILSAEYTPHIRYGVAIMEITSNFMGQLNLFVTHMFPAVRSSLSCKCAPINTIEATLPLNYDKFQQTLEFSMQTAVDDTKYRKYADSDEKCSACGKMSKRSYKINDFVVILMEARLDLQETQKTITLKNQQYALNSSAEHDRKHGISNCLRADRKWYSYNDNGDIVQLPSSKKIKRVLVYVRK